MKIVVNPHDKQKISFLKEYPNISLASLKSGVCFCNENEKGIMQKIIYNLHDSHSFQTTIIYDGLMIHVIYYCPLIIQLSSHYLLSIIRLSSGYCPIIFYSSPSDQLLMVYYICTFVLTEPHMDSSYTIQGPNFDLNLKMVRVQIFFI